MAHDHFWAFDYFNDRQAVPVSYVWVRPGKEPGTVQDSSFSSPALDRRRREGLWVTLERGAGDYYEITYAWHRDYGFDVPQSEIGLVAKHLNGEKTRAEDSVFYLQPKKGSSK